MQKRLKMIKKYLLKGYSLEKIGNLLKLEEGTLFSTLQRNACYFDDLFWVRRK